MGENDIKINDRINYIDFLRAYGILVMIMGHVGFGGIFDKWIHTFHMPMFFIISGYFYKDKPLSILVVRRLKTVLLPYVFFGLIACLLYFAEIRQIDFAVFKILLWENTALNGVPLAGAIWFLAAMFLADVFFCLINKISTNINVITTVVVLVTIAGMVFATYLPFRLPFAADVAMVGVGLFHTGWLLTDIG